MTINPEALKTLRDCYRERDDAWALYRRADEDLRDALSVVTAFVEEDAIPDVAPQQEMTPAEKMNRIIDTAKTEEEAHLLAVHVFQELDK